jgi:hypothetical protein
MSKPQGVNLASRSTFFNVSTESEIESAFAGLTEQRVGGLLVADDPFLQGQRGELVRLAKRHASRRSTSRETSSMRAA